jgi:DNA-binding response OmpR family regulator
MSSLPKKPIEITPRTSLTKKRVMICDNNKIKFAEVIQALQEADFEVSIIDDKPKIISTAAQFQPDLVLINLFMSSGNTLSLIKELKGVTERQGAKIIVLTAHQSKENLMECVKAGANDFVIEPFVPRQLLQRIKYQLQDREAYSPDDLRSEPTQVLAGFQLVYDCLRILAEVKETNRCIYEVLKRVSELSQSPRVNLILADVAQNSGIVISSSDDPKVENLDVDLEKYPEVREVILKGSIVYIKDITQNPLTKDIKKQLKDIDMTSLLVFPVRHRQETLGTLAIRLGKDGMAISDKHLKTFYMIALCIAPKVAARKLLKKIEKANASS